MKIIIVEDDKTASARLETMINLALKENGIDGEIVCYENGVRFLSEYGTDCDIVFLDYDMPMMNGMTVAKKLREKDENVIIIFVTNLMQYAVEGYEVDALDYIVKPLEYSAFARKFARALRKVYCNDKQIISVKSGRSIVKIGVDDIYYIEIRGHAMTYHTVSGTIDSRGTLSKMEEVLETYNIVRCASCYMVNLKYVKKIESDNVILVNGAILALTRTKKKEFMNKLAAYVNR